ncbi:hypothetical protein FACS1894178_8950 [Bacteroidia bacterium]|nr:hypothetical protein FACS1894178_8950 [Bacteroidia bacterium]
MKKNKTLDDLKNIYVSLYDYEQGEEKIKIYNDYLQSLRKLAYNGNIEAQYELAQHYEDMGVMGWPNPYCNTKKCFYWYLKAAENNHASACNNLANYYLVGDIVEKNISKALALYEKSLSLDKVSYVKENYVNLIKEVNAAILSKVLLDKQEGTMLNDLLEEKYRAVITWEVDCLGQITKLLCIDNMRDIFEDIEMSMQGKKIIFNMYKPDKFVKIDFPQTLMKYYKQFKNDNNKYLSKIDYLRYRTNLFYPRYLE